MSFILVENLIDWITEHTNYFVKVYGLCKWDDKFEYVTDEHWHRIELKSVLSYGDIFNKADSLVQMTDYSSFQYMRHECELVDRNMRTIYSCLQAKWKYTQI